jgi:hypothetical protein
MIIKITYGETIWEEMGEELIQWNLTAVGQANEAFFAFWLVDIFHFCEYFDQIESSCVEFLTK